MAIVSWIFGPGVLAAGTDSFDAPSPHAQGFPGCPLSEVAEATSRGGATECRQLQIDGTTSCRTTMIGS